MIDGAPQLKNYEISFELRLCFAAFFVKHLGHGTAHGLSLFFIVEVSFWVRDYLP